MYLLTATPEMTDVFQRLCHMKPGSGIGMVGLGSVLLHQKEFLMARALLQKGAQSNFELIRIPYYMKFWRHFSDISDFSKNR